MFSASIVEKIIAPKTIYPTVMMVIPTVLKNIIEPFLHTSSHSYVLPGLAFLVRAPRVSKSSQLSTKFFVDKTDVANDDIGSLH